MFDNKNKNIEVTSKQFLKRFGFCLSKCFRKVRIGKTKKNIELDNLFTKRRILRNKTDQNSYEELKRVEEKMADMCARDNYQIIQEACEGLACTEGGVNVGKVWSLKRKLRGIVAEPPTAMIDSRGNLEPQVVQ